MLPRCQQKYQPGRGEASGGVNTRHGCAVTFHMGVSSRPRALRCACQKATVLGGFVAPLMPGWAVAPPTALGWLGGSPLSHGGSRAGSLQRWWEQGRVPVGGICPGILMEGTGEGWELAVGTPDPHARGFRTPGPSREGSQGQARPPAQARRGGQHSRVPPSPLPPVADGSDITPYHPYFIFSRVFLARPTLAEEALGESRLCPGLAWPEQLNKSPSHIVCLYLRLISTYYAAVSSSMASAGFICGRGAGCRAELPVGSPRACALG